MQEEDKMRYEREIQEYLLNQPEGRDNVCTFGHLVSRVSLVMAVMSGVWVQSQMVDASPLGSKDILVPGYRTYQLLQLGSP